MAWTPITTVEQLVARFESSTLDYKITYDLATKATRYDIAKDVAAFANAYGGTIVVGVFESGGRAVRIDGVADFAKLTREVATALQMYCAPVPSTPEEHAIAVTPADATRLLASSGALAPRSDVSIVTLNVRPDPRGPIGVRPLDATAEGPIDGAYRFPVRVDDETRFIDPTELPMWMNSHERRIAIQLRQIVPGSTVRLFGTPHDEQEVKLVGVDEDQMIAIFSPVVAGGPAHVPLTYVAAVWPEARGEIWSMKVLGRIFRDHRYAFKPSDG